MPILNRFKRQAPMAENDSPLHVAVRDAMKDVQAYARSHGGDIRLVGVTEEGDVKIQFRGACVGCPMSTLTLKVGIEERLRVIAPGVRNVLVA